MQRVAVGGVLHKQTVAVGGVLTTLGQRGLTHRNRCDENYILG